MSAATSNLSVAASLTGGSAARQGVAILLGAFLIAGAAQIAIGWPIPMTLQTLAVLTVAALAACASARVRSPYTLPWEQLACRSSPI